MDKANVLAEGTDALLVACGEMVPYAKKAQKILENQGYSVGLIDMYCIKPMDQEGLLSSAQKAKVIVTVEEHSAYGGLGSIVSQVIGEHSPKKVVNIALPDGHIIPGTNKEIFKHYGMDAVGIADTVAGLLE